MFTLGFHKATYIHPNLVMKPVENDFIVRKVVIPENGFSFWA
jgi:hypothetical protein